MIDGSFINRRVNFIKQSLKQNGLNCRDYSCHQTEQDRCHSHCAGCVSPVQNDAVK
jgi:hypothetical protein